MQNTHIPVFEGCWQMKAICAVPCWTNWFYYQVDFWFPSTITMFASMSWCDVVKYGSFECSFLIFMKRICDMEMIWNCNITTLLDFPWKSYNHLQSSIFDSISIRRTLFVLQCFSSSASSVTAMIAHCPSTNQCHKFHKKTTQLYNATSINNIQTESNLNKAQHLFVAPQWKLFCALIQKKLYHRNKLFHSDWLTDYTDFVP